MTTQMRADTRIKRRRSFRIRKHRVQKCGQLRPADSWNRDAHFAGEPAFVAGLIQSGHNIEVSAATEHQAILIRWALDSRGDSNELPAGGRAPIHVVGDDRDSRGGRGCFPPKRNAVRRGFVTAREAQTKQSTCRQQEPGWVGSHGIAYRLIAYRLIAYRLSSID
jgi:hypothetical protein